MWCIRVENSNERKKSKDYFNQEEKYQKIIYTSISWDIFYDKLKCLWNWKGQIFHGRSFYIWIRFRHKIRWIKIPSSNGFVLKRLFSVFLTSKYNNSPIKFLLKSVNYNMFRKHPIFSKNHWVFSQADLRQNLFTKVNWRKIAAFCNQLVIFVKSPFIISCHLRVWKQNSNATL